MITLKLTRSEFLSMIQYLRFNTAYQQQMPLRSQSTNMLVMIDYLASWLPHRVVAWSGRRVDKLHSLRMKLVVARALHQEMQVSMLTGHQQLFLDKLDEAIVNYRNPHADYHSLMELR